MDTTRDLFDLYRALGGDNLLRTSPISDGVALVYALDNLQWALPHRASYKLVWTAQPTAVAAQLGTVELTPTAGMWIRRFVNLTNNSSFALTPLAPTPITTLQVPSAATLVAPETAGVLVAGALSGGVSFGRIDTFAEFNGVTGLQQTPVPDLFVRAQAGATAGGLFNSVFMPTSTVEYLRDFWVPPGVTAQWQCTTLNTTPNWYMELEFPASQLVQR